MNSVLLYKLVTDYPKMIETTLESPLPPVLLLKRYMSLLKSIV